MEGWDEAEGMGAGRIVGTGEWDDVGATGTGRVTGIGAGCTLDVADPRTCREGTFLF